MRRPHLISAGRVRPANPSLAFPIRAAYYFPWYPEGWDQFGYTPFTRYTPTLGAGYDQDDPAIVQQHVEWAKAANLDALIPTWRGRADGTGISAISFAAGAAGPAPWSEFTDARIEVLLDQSLQHGLKVAILYEIEGYADPSASQIRDELDYLAAGMFAHPAYLHVDGLPVLWVYAAADGSSALAQRYSDATDGFTTAYVGIQSVNDPSALTPQPQAWFTFSNSRTSPMMNSYTLCPGYWRIDEANPVTARDLPTWQANIASMVVSGAEWQLINSFNEWGEGSQLEPSVELGTDYLDALA